MPCLFLDVTSRSICNIHDCISEPVSKLGKYPQEKEKRRLLTQPEHQTFLTGILHFHVSGRALQGNIRSEVSIVARSTGS